MIPGKLCITVLLADSFWLVAVFIFAFDEHCEVFWHSSAPTVGSFDYRILLIASVTMWAALQRSLGSDALASSWTPRWLFSWLLISLVLLNLAVKVGVRCLGMRPPDHRLLYFTLLISAGMVAIRLLALRSFRKRRLRRTAILGGQRVARELAASFARHPELRTEVVGIFGMSGQGGGREPAREGLSNISTLEIVELLKQMEVTELIIALSHSVSRQVANLVPRCRAEGISVSLVPRFYQLYMTRAELVEVGGIPLLRMEQQEESASLRNLKPVIDFVLATALFVLSSPLLALAAIQLKMRNGRAFKTEMRCGRNGRLFPMYRLAVAGNGPGSPWLAGLLWKTSLSELPQLWNVLRGEMSVVGPRPETPERLKHYSDWHRQRLRVKPGITGLAQVEGLRDQNSSDEKNRFDLQYILGWSPLLDLVLLIQTCWTVVDRLRARTGTGRRPETGTNSLAMVEDHAYSAQSYAD